MLLGVVYLLRVTAQFTPRIVIGDPAKAQENLVLFGDNINALQHLVATSDAEGIADLVYIDPPYNTGRTFERATGEHAYTDAWPTDAAFLMFLRARLRLLTALMSSRGSLYLHIDHNYGYLARRMIDRTVGRKHFRNEITRIKSNPKNSSRKAFGNETDVIYFYSLPDAIWNDLREPISDAQAARYSKVDGSGRRYATSPIYADGAVRDGATGRPWRGLMPPVGKHWARPPAELDELDRQGRIEWSKTGNPRRKIYLDEAKGPRIQDVWEFKDKGGSRDSYPTEKNLALLERIVLQSSQPGSTVLDCFMGSGTTLVAAAKHGRRFIGIDQSPSSLAAAITRLTSEASASYTVLAPSPIVEEGGHPAGLRADLLASRQAGATAFAAHLDTDSVWRATPLLEAATTGAALPRDSTHLLVVERSGRIRAMPTRHERGSATPAFISSVAPHAIAA